jgi:transcriptional regulator with XRE-family HTH domain
MLNKFAEELKEARTKSQLTLQQIAAKTRIDLKFLEYMENGNFNFLPDLYIKAFIKEYAKLVGLDVETTFKKYDAAKRNKAYDENGNVEEEIKKPKPEKEEIKPETEAAPKPISIDYTDTSENKKSPTPINANAQKIRLAVLIGVGVVILLVIYFAFLRGGSDIIVTEKPYNEVRKENTKRYVEETKKPEAAKPEEVSTSDSLYLKVETSDTSWVKILLDGTKVDEYTLFPNSEKVLKAKNNFNLIIGNAGVMRFFLNNKPLNFEGKKYQVKYILIDSSGLKYLENPPSLLQ